MQNTPKYIKEVPWYAQNNQGKGQTINVPSFQPKTQINSSNYHIQKGYQATSYRKGACQNCGAMGHNKKDCTERPRKIGAKYTNQKIASDDIAQNKNIVFKDHQSKKDRWNGFEPEMYKEVIQEYEIYEEIRKKNKLNEGAQDIDQEFKKEENPLQVANLPTKHAKNQKHQGLGGLRHRQDRAKYLLNLDLNGPHFDPKSRAMKGEEALYNLQVDGQKAALQDQINFASQQHKKHNAQISSIALPTLTEKIYKSVKQKTYLNQSSRSTELTKKYDAGSGKLQAPQLVVYEQKDDFEFNALVHSHRQSTVKSRYEENVFFNDHTSVWGSWYSRTLGWGYACCYATQKMSYCLGEKGKEKALARELKTKAQKLREEQKLIEITEKEQENDSQKPKEEE